MTCRAAHLGECFGGWIEADQRVAIRREGDTTRKVPQQMTVEPCPVCRPGRRAVWEAGLDRGPGPWMDNPEALRVYATAEPLPKDLHRRAFGGDVKKIRDQEIA